MKPGDLVIVMGKLDSRVREKSKDDVVIGTLESFLDDERVLVILPNDDLWVGLKREIAPYEAI